MSKTGIIVQARMGSVRLPGKVLLPLGVTPLLLYLVDRVSSHRRGAQLVVATSDLEQDHAIIKLCQAHHINCFAGSESDVLDRFVQCALQFDFQQIVRLTADNPFVDVEELDRLIAFHNVQACDYSYSYHCLPKGVGAEMFSRSALMDSHAKGLAPNHREHVNEYILEHEEQFAVSRMTVPARKCRPDVHLSVDTREEYDLICQMVSRLEGAEMTTEKAIEIYDQFKAR